MKTRTIFILFFCVPLFFLAGSLPSVEKQINWQGIQQSSFTETETRTFISFEGANYSAENNFLPEYFERIKLNEKNPTVNVSLTDEIFLDLTEQEIALLKGFEKTSVQVISTVGYDRKEPYALVRFIPIRKNTTTGKFEKLISFKLNVEQNNSTSDPYKFFNNGQKIFAPNSVLASGTWYKIGITKDGVYKLTPSFLTGIGIDISNTDPRKIRIYGNGGGMLPYANSGFRRDDLTENAIYVYGENDGVLDQNDYVLFYGQGPTRWSYNASSCPPFRHQVNQYSDTTYYFINVDLGNGKRIFPQASSASLPTVNVTSFDDYRYVEDDNTNLIKSGREFYGVNFDIITSYSFGFDFQNIDASSPASVRTDMAGRNTSGTSFFKVDCQSSTATVTTPPVGADYFDDYAAPGAGCFSFTPGSNDMSVTITKQTSAATGWLNYLEVYARRMLIMSGDQMVFRDSKSVGAGNISQFNLNMTNPLTIWDVTDPTTVKQQQATLAGNQYQYVLQTDTMHEFMAFNGNNFYVPVFAGKVVNQNLHALPQADLIIVSNPLFINEANILASHHRTADGLTVNVVTPQQIYNEFSSGAQDVSAIRDFMKMFYDRATISDMPKYMLLYGDGSYDNKHRVSSNTNFIPTYQSANSYSYTNSYVSDDFYGLLDNNEGDWTPSA